MPEFGVNQSNALNAISKVNFTDEEYFNEFIGGLASEAKTYIKIINNHPEIKNTIIIYGDDNGFNEENRHSFTTTYDSNGYGIGEHGQGCRAAFNEFMKLHMRGLQMYTKNNDYFFGIISHNPEIGWTVIKITFNYEKKDFCIEYEYDNDNEIYHQFYKNNLNSSGTMFFIPNIFHSSNMEDCIQNYKKMLNYRIHNDNLKFYYNNNEILLNHSLISNHDISCLYQKFKILPVRARKNNNNKKGKLCDMFRFEPDPFNENSIYHFTKYDTKPDIYNLDQVEIDTDNSNHKYIQNDNFILCEISNIKNKDMYPNHEKDYNISNLAHDCGYWIYKKNILINMKPFGVCTRGEGSGFSPQISFHIDNVDLLKTEANKTKLNKANLKQPFSTIMKYIKEEYKNLYRKSLEIPNPLPPNPPSPNPPSPNPPSPNPPSPNPPSPNPPSPSRNNIPISIKNCAFYEQYQPKCIICEKFFSEKNSHEACHIQSDKNGGTNDKKNTLIACFQCNRNMSSHNMMEWISSNWGNNSPTYKRVHDELLRLNKNIF